MKSLFFCGALLCLTGSDLYAQDTYRPGMTYQEKLEFRNNQRLRRADREASSRRERIQLKKLPSITLPAPTYRNPGPVVFVSGYFLSNGTYVPPHFRSAPDGDFYNNWSTWPNVNPYTLETGTQLYPRTRYEPYR